MTFHGLRDLTRLAAAAAIALGTAGSVSAQETDADRQALRARQDELFAQMFEAPDDIDLMFEYALTSIKLKDYEAAISTLDRILIYNPELTQARLELGASYYRIGSYPIAKLYFNQVLKAENATEKQKARAQAFINEIAKRTNPSSFSGVVGFSAIFSTNANSGPDTRDILFGGVITQLTGANVTAQTDVGAAVTLSLTHKYDLGLPSEDFWQTDFAGYFQRFASTNTGAADVVFLRTGPRLSLTDDRYGPKGRPFVEADHVRSANSPLYSTIGVGFEYSDTIDSQTSVNAEARLGWREYSHNSAQDGLNLQASAGMTYFADDMTTLRGKTFLEWEGADDPGQRSTKIGVEGAVSWRYDSGFDFANRPWVATVSGRASYRFFDEPGFASPTIKRKDKDFRIAVGNTAFIDNGLAISMKANYQIRDSNIFNFDLDGLTVTAGVLMPF